MCGKQRLVHSLKNRNYKNKKNWKILWHFYKWCLHLAVCNSGCQFKCFSHTTQNIVQMKQKLIYNKRQTITPIVSTTEYNFLGTIYNLLFLRVFIRKLLWIMSAKFKSRLMWTNKQLNTCIPKQTTSNYYTLAKWAALTELH